MRLFFQGNDIIQHGLAKVQSSTCTTYGKCLWYLRWPWKLLNWVFMLLSGLSSFISWLFHSFCNYWFKCRRCLFYFFLYQVSVSYKTDKSSFISILSSWYQHAKSFNRLIQAISHKRFTVILKILVVSSRGFWQKSDSFYSWIKPVEKGSFLNNIGLFLSAREKISSNL